MRTVPFSNGQPSARPLTSAKSRRFIGRNEDGSDHVFSNCLVAHLKAVPAGVRYGHARSTDENPTIAFDLSKQMER
jgi:hypothetical protein